MRRLSSKKKRAQLWLDFQGRCAICNEILKKNWHADHKIPFYLIKETLFENMQPLCPICNLQKGKKMSSIKNNDYYEKINLGQYVDITPFRIGQKGAFNCIIEKISEKASTISIVLPTRYGKSDVIRASAIEAISQNKASGCLIAAPCKFLRDQLVKKNKIQEMLLRYSVKPKPIIHDILDSFRLPIIQNNEHFIALTTQMLALNADQISQYIQQFVNKTGKPFLVYIDESHTSSEGNSWGEVVPKIVSAGGIVILCTATPFRDDGKEIPGFKYIKSESKENDKKHFRRTEHPNPNKYFLEVYKDLESSIQLQADYEYSFKRAWSEGNVICKISQADYDVVVEVPMGEMGETKEVKISKMSVKECAKYLGKIVRDPKVIKQGVENLINRLSDYRLSEPSAQAIIFCGNDLDDIDDGHAKQIAAEIKSQTSKFNSVIATSKVDNPDDLIKKFGEGKGDILIVKQMASLGLDIPQIKVGLHLSSVRTLAAFIQQLMRIATMWGKNEVAHFIIPSDVKFRALWEGFINENGGSMIQHEYIPISVVEKDVLDDEEVLKNESFKVIRTEPPTLSDTFNKDSSDSKDYEEFARPIIFALPKIQAVYSDHELITIAKNHFSKEALNQVYAETPQVDIKDITEQRILIKSKIKQLADDVTNKKYNYGQEPKKWVEFRRKLFWQAKRKAGINSKKIKLESITNIDALIEMKEFFETQLTALSV